MSWGVNVIGTPDAICRELARLSATMDGPSKLEFDDAKPALMLLLNQNFHRQREQPVMRLEAHGHGSCAVDGGQVQEVQRACTVKIEFVNERLVT